MEETPEQRGVRLLALEKTLDSKRVRLIELLEGSTAASFRGDWFLPALVECVHKSSVELETAFNEFRGRFIELALLEGWK